ncbi:MAG: cation-translocating P-type ATPase, partial [Chthonomonas sp.]|nr:cation-translocating P-type ATPase [Chthonomonas sp.]
MTDRGDQEIPVASLAVGDLVRVLPFNQIPTDAVVESGTSEVNEAAMTGESVPVNKFAGDRILAGTQNLSGMFVARVTAASGETTLEKIVNLVSEAQENKASGERISVWFGQRYTFFVVAAFAVSLGVRFLAGQQTHDAFYGALTLLVALSPCAVVISTPATTLSALAWAARHGMLIRGGEFIELAGRIDAIALDKTGTLTTGRPELVEICVCERVPAGAAVAVRLGDACNDDGCWHGTPQMSPAATHILQFAAAAEQYSTHPIAEAITEAARARQIAVPEATQQQAHSGLGVEAIIEGVRVRVGQRRFFETQHDQFEPEFATKIERMQQKGMTVAVLEVEGRLAALGLRDHVRGESFAVVRELEELGVNPIAILTGDTAQTAGAVAEEVKVSEVH